MPKRTYSDSDKAAVYVALQVNDNNIKRTSRDTGISESTIRDWRTAWDRDGVPLEIMDATEQIASDFVADAERVRDLALTQLEQRIRSGELKADRLITVIGVLEDKIRLGKGLATSRSETVHALPSAQEMRELLGGYVLDALERQTQREEDIIEVEAEEIIPPRELLAANTGG